MNVTVPKEVKKIGKSAFSECKKLVSITLPEGLTTLSVDVFKNCPNLKAVNLPKTLTKIATGVFINTGFESITIPEGVTTLESWIFENCANLKSVTLPKGLTTIENYAFQNSGLKSITVPEGVTTLGVDVFYDCKNLTSITLPQTLTAIGNRAFAGSGLKSIELPKTLTKIGDYTFYNCKNLTSITLPQTLTAIGNRAFAGSGLKSIELPKTLTKIGDNAFHNSGLESITIPEGITTLGESVFRDCVNLKSVTLPQTLTAIENHVFYNCKNLTSIALPQTLTAIGNRAFASTGLKSIELPKTLTKIGAFGFEKSGLESVTVPEGITTLEVAVFTGCSNLKTVNLPQTLTAIENRVFENCSSLTGTLKIPKQVKTIGSDAFKNTSLTKLDCSEFNHGALLNAPWGLSEDKIIYKNETSIIKEIITTEKPLNTLNAGILMGTDHDRQDLGIQLEKDSVIKIKQVNANYKEKLVLRLLTNDSHTETYTTFSQNGVAVRAKDLSVPFIDTPYIQKNGEKPKIEITVGDGKRVLPKYNQETSLDDFINKWNTNEGYALLQGTRFQTLFPEENKREVLSTNLNHVINMYDNNIIGLYNELIGLTNQASNPINQAPNRRYFYKADKHGVGFMYYGRYWAAQSNGSASAWLSDGWGSLHETGHGYQGSFMNKEMRTSEVWNNIYGVIYNYKYMGKQEADRNSWLYDYGNKTNIENSFTQLITTGNMDYNNLNGREQLLFLSNLIDKSGNEGLKYFYTKYREDASKSGFNDSNYPLPDLLVTNLGNPKKYDFSAVLNAWKVKVKEESKVFAKNQEYRMVAHLAQVVPNNLLQTAIGRYTQNNRLSSVLSLVTNKELDELGLTSNITLQFPSKELFEGTNLKIYRDNQLYREVSLDKESVTINNMPNGVYSLELDSNVGYISQPYLFVKDNQIITVPLVNYVREATQTVQSLYQENTDKIKSNIMKQNIDNAKKYVDALPESGEKIALLSKLKEAYNQLQEFTFRGLGDWTFATFDVANGMATIRINSGKPHVYFEDQYASISITRNGSVIYDKKFIGNQHYSSEMNTISLENGDLISITHKEPNDIRLAVNHSYLKNNNGTGTYSYQVEDGLLKLVS